MAYGMTYRQDNDFTDIEKNLFQDYYTNNLMRFICNSSSSGIESDPSGQSINYKNFAEMVYLYFIAQNTYSPIEKIELSSGMIDRLRDSSPSRKIYSTNFTGIFRTQVQSIFRMPPEKFEAFLRENYNCFTGGTKGLLQLETEHNTALKIYTQILSKCSDIPERNCEGLWFTDVDAFTLRLCTKTTFLVIALADGVSSCRMAREGAEIACVSFTELMLKTGSKFFGNTGTTAAKMILAHVRA